MNSPLSISRLSTGYRNAGRQHLVGQGLSAQLSASALTALIGLNGCGKTTLLRTLSGLLAPISGEICYGTKPLADFTPRQLAQTVAVVLTSLPDTGFLRVREIVEMGRMPYTPFSGRISEEDRQIVSQAMEATEVSHLSRRLLSSLSDGERQRVMIAKALSQQTPVILLDEPGAYLDFRAKKRLMDLLARLAHEEHKAILVSTHDVGNAIRSADQCWLLSPDQLLTGTPSALSADGTLIRFLNLEAPCDLTHSSDPTTP
ncbi:MAG: ABC transporter ATP-binding protein [Alloprevotella sp.]|nr:ABC transporter ATP-binding protein [Alloprevotella sp.]